MRLLAWLRPGPLLRPQVRLWSAAFLVGIVAGLAAIVFFVACQVVVHYALGVGAGYRPMDPNGERPLSWLPEITTTLRPVMLIVIPTLGGLVCGLIVFTLAPEAEGHGTDAVITAYHRQLLIRPIVPLVKLVASAITLGTGGAGGREGPIAQVGAGFGSYLANLLQLSATERRILLAAGMGAGIAAIFRAPLAGALFAAEVLYSSSEFEPEVIMPAALASVVAYCTFGSVFGWMPLFSGLESLSFHDPWLLGPYLILAIAMTFLARLYVRTFYGITDLFHRLRIPRHVKPAIGGGLTGLIAVGLYYALGHDTRAFGTLSTGYGLLQEAMSWKGAVPATVLLLVALGRIVTTGLTIGSGGSAGVFGSSMVIGGCAGGAVGIVLQQLWPTVVVNPASFVIVGMAGFFAAAAKTPFSTLLMVVELTTDYGLLLPALWVCSISFLFSGPESIYSAQVESRTHSPAHQGSLVLEALSTIRVRELLRSDHPLSVLHPEEPIAAVVDRLGRTLDLALPVLDADGKLLGVVNLDEQLLKALHPPEDWQTIQVRQVMRADAPRLAPDDTLERALEQFLQVDLPALPVTEGPRFLAMIRRNDLARGFLREVRGSP